MATCKQCGLKTGFLQDVCESCQEKNREAVYADIEKERATQERLEISIASVILSTGDIRVPYDIIDVVFVMAAHKAGFFESSANPGIAFSVLQRSLKERAVSLEANAVIHCQFEYRAAISQVIHSQVLELFAYGTAVRYKVQK